MRVLSAKATNFASYKELAFEFTSQGLVLLSGPTGAGKSTLCDLVPWILFGKTSKGGAVDEIRSWGINDITDGCVIIENNGVAFTVIRQRGSAKDNDLYLTNCCFDERAIRGKDLNDTQKLINERLGFDYETYLSGAYFHEFSQTAAFFTATAKNRRQITEQLVDFSLANKLAEAGKARLKAKTATRTSLEKNLLVTTERVKHLKNAVNREAINSALWENRRQEKSVELETLAHYFERDREDDETALLQAYSAKQAALEIDLKEACKDLLATAYFEREYARLDSLIADLGDTRCAECGALKDSAQRMTLIKARYTVERNEADNKLRANNIVRLEQSLQTHKESVASALAAINSRFNGYGDQALKIRAEKNPHLIGMQKSKEQLDNAAADIQDTERSLASIGIEIADLELLQDIVSEFRGILVKNTVDELQAHTNRLLDTYFDAEIRVKFSVPDADKLEVMISKDGHECSYTQLSKGQRQLLKLCFSVSVMRSVSMHNGVTFNALFFDEVFSGLDEVMKAKGFRLLESLALEHESVFCIDHSEELKTRFNRRYEVELVDGESKIQEA